MKRFFVVMFSKTNRIKLSLNCFVNDFCLSLENPRIQNIIKILINLRFYNKCKSCLKWMKLPRIILSTKQQRINKIN